MKQARPIPPILRDALYSIFCSTGIHMQATLVTYSVYCTRTRSLSDWCIFKNTPNYNTKEFVLKCAFLEASTFEAIVVNQSDFMTLSLLKSMNKKNSTVLLSPCSSSSSCTPERDFSMLFTLYMQHEGIKPQDMVVITRPKTNQVIMFVLKLFP